MRARQLSLTVGRCVLGTALVVALVAGAASPVFAQQSRSWDLKETPYEQRTLAMKIGTNVRDGTVGIVNNFGQAFFGGFHLANGLFRKASTFVGDVAALVDNNPWTERVLNGVASRHLLRFGAGMMHVPGDVAHTHDASWKTPTASMDDFIAPGQYFRMEAYANNSTLAGLGAVALANVVVRPIGNLVTMFGGRKMGQELDEWGLDLVEQSLKVRFL